VVRRVRLIAVVGTFLIGCVVLLVLVGCAGVRSEATKQEQGRSPEATASEEARCEGTRTVRLKYLGKGFTTNDVPGCPKGGLLVGTDGPDKLFGGEGDDEIRGLGARDFIVDDSGNNTIYGGPGDDYPIFGGEGEDVIHGGPGDDDLVPGNDKVRDRLYCGEGSDEYMGGKGDFVSSSCEEKMRFGPL